MKVKMNKTVMSYVKDGVYEVIGETRNTYMLKNYDGMGMSINKRNCEPVGFMGWLKRVFK